ncbi:hypothetical protein LRF89_11895, partial [Halorhodospira sp. 9621]
MIKQTTLASTLVLAMALSGNAWANPQNTVEGEENEVSASVNADAEGSSAAASEQSSANVNNSSQEGSYNTDKTYSSERTYNKDDNSDN